MVTAQPQFPFLDSAARIFWIRWQESERRAAPPSLLLNEATQQSANSPSLQKAVAGFRHVKGTRKQGHCNPLARRSLGALLVAEDRGRPRRGGHPHSIFVAKALSWQGAGKEFLIGIHQAVANLEFHGDPHLVADGDRVICGLEGGGTHTGSAFMDCLIGFLPANSGRKLHLAGTTVLRIRDGKVLEDATRMTWVSLLPRFRKAAAYLDNDVTRPSQPQPDPRRSR